MAGVRDGQRSHGANRSRHRSATRGPLVLGALGRDPTGDPDRPPGEQREIRELAAAPTSMFAVIIRQIVGAAHIDYGQPVVAIQRQVEMLAMFRVRATQWAVLAGVAVWAPFAIVVGKAFLGIDSYNAPWLLANVAFGLGLIPLAVWLSRTFSVRMGRSPFIQRVMKDLAGYNLKAASASLARLSEFEAEISAR